MQRVDYSVLRSTKSRRRSPRSKRKKYIPSRMRKCKRKALNCASLGIRTRGFSKKRRACSIIFFYEQYFVLRTRSRDDFRRWNQDSVSKQTFNHSSNIYPCDTSPFIKNIYWVSNSSPEFCITFIFTWTLELKFIWCHKNKHRDWPR